MNVDITTTKTLYKFNVTLVNLHVPNALMKVNALDVTN